VDARFHYTASDIGAFGVVNVIPEQRFRRWTRRCGGAHDKQALSGALTCRLFVIVDQLEEMFTPESMVAARRPSATANIVHIKFGG
jgi:hypothetical protein